MARKTDDSKIEKIRMATIKLVVSEGYGGASVSKIAKEAGVAEGYLYRHYEGKKDLINCLLHESMSKLIDKIETLEEEKQSINNIITKTIETLFDLAVNDTPRMKFIYVLINDYNFRIDEEIHKRTIGVCRDIHKRGITSNEFSPEIDPEDVYLMTVSYPIQFINHRLKSFFGRTELNDSVCKKVAQISIKALTQNK